MLEFTGKRFLIESSEGNGSHEEPVEDEIPVQEVTSPAAETGNVDILRRKYFWVFHMFPK